MSTLRYEKTIGLAVSGDVRLTKLEVDIIDTPAFQRLRRIKQLGPSSWVYPTAVHTRFDHSIGVLKVADQMVTSIHEILEQINAPDAGRAFPITKSQRILARLYALLHDITHIPFGHTLEDELHIFTSHDAFQKSAGSESGLDRFETLLGETSAIGKLIAAQLGPRMYDRFRNIYLKGKFSRLEVDDQEGRTADEFVYYLVSDTVCADLLDYIQRDDLFCNLGLRTPKRILNYLFVTDVKNETGEDRRRVVIRLWKPKDGLPRRDILTDLAGLLDARYMLAERVYFHPAKLIVGTMIGRSVLEAKLAGLLEPIDLLRFGDEDLLDHLRELKSKRKAKGRASEQVEVAVRIARDVSDRRLYDRIQRYTDESFSDGAINQVDVRAELLKNLSSAEDRRLHENQIAEIAGARHGEILIYVGPKNMNMKVADAMVEWSGEQIPLRKLDRSKEPVLMSRLLSIEESHKRLWVTDLMVHPDLDETQRQLAIIAFDASFLPRKQREKSWYLVVNRIVATEPSFGNRNAEDRDNAVRIAARKLADEGISLIAGHGRGEAINAREYLLQLVRDAITEDQLELDAD
jgi:hypothetical protein